MTGIDTFTFLALHYFGVRYLEALVIVLISTILVCFSINWADAVPHQSASVLMTGWVVPMLQRYAVLPAAGTLGAVVMPHNLYLHSGLVLSRKVDRTSHKAIADAVRYYAIESTCALMVSFAINLSVVAVFAHLFFHNACAESKTACLPEGVVMEGFLSLKMSPWARIAVTRAAALGPAVILAFSTSQNPSLLNGINAWLNILQSVQVSSSRLDLSRLISSRLVSSRLVLSRFVSFRPVLASAPLRSSPFRSAPLLSCAILL